MTSFFYLSKPDSLEKWAAWSAEVELASVRCPQFSGHQRSGKRLTSLSVLLQSKKVEDIVWTWFDECLIQAKVIQFFRKHGMKGWKAKPARAKFERASGNPPALWELIVTGWGGLATPKSGIRLRKWCRYCGHTTYGPLSRPENLIDPEKWDGTDFFIVWPLPKFIFVTPKVVRLLQENRISGWTATPVEQLRLRGGFSPGRLEHYMPLRLARRRVESPEMA